MKISESCGGTGIRWTKIPWRRESIRGEVVISTFFFFLIWGRGISWFWVWTRSLHRQKSYLGGENKQQRFSWSCRADITITMSGIFSMENLHWSLYIMAARGLGQNVLRGRMKHPAALRYVGNKDPSGRKHKIGLSSKIFGGRFWY